ncbi:hypothetical protein DSO57_1022889 [Entomophthora muscae]|uniref:Uncharacterized protein n=1 Tax=Entomophthora muscae TaxID=34485 RepID=A0ACC2T3C8_9FUNG|nr:hypothetical protein DSO57_1022889 [Entomophthora muscae]
MEALKIKMRKWVAKVRFSRLVHHTNRNPSPFEDSTEYVKATFTLLQISRKGQNFVEIVLLAIELLSIQDPSTPGCLYHFIDATALPKAAALLQLNSRMIKICQKPHKSEAHEGRRAMCALVWSILASKLAGKASSQLLTDHVVDILFDGIKCHHSMSIQIFFTDRHSKLHHNS